MATRLERMRADVQAVQHDQETLRRCTTGTGIVPWTAPPQPRPMPLEFTEPLPAKHTDLACLLSLAALGLLMLVASTALRHLDDAPAHLTFGFLLLGSGMGFVLESLMLLVGANFDEKLLKFWGPAVLAWRRGIAALVYLCVQCLVLSKAGLDATAVWQCGLWFAPVLYFFAKTRNKLLAVYLFAARVFDIGFLIHWHAPDGRDKALGILAELFLLASLVCPPKAPLNASLYHLLVSAGGYFLMLFCARGPPVELDLGLTSVVFALFGLTLLGVVAKDQIRYTLSCAAWTVIHTLLFVRNITSPPPASAARVVVGDQVSYQDWSVVPGRTVRLPLRIPTPARIPPWAEHNIESVSKFFNIIDSLDQSLPAHRVTDNGTLCSRECAVGTTPMDVVPPHLFHLGNGGGWTPPHDTVMRAWQAGQLLGYFVTYGVGATWLQREEGTDRICMDFTSLDALRTKPGYLHYGGKAYFRLVQDREDRDYRRFELEGLREPQAAPAAEAIAVNPADETFRRVEQQLLMSLILKTVAGKHLAGLHLAGNVVAAAVHNAFHVQGMPNHPVRIWLHPHVYSHTMIANLTVPHLLNDNAVFQQIFGLSQEALYTFMETSFREPWSHDMRFAQFRGLFGDDVPTNAALSWLERYYEVFRNYFATLVNGHYATDEAVANDRYLKRFSQDLATLSVEPLTTRAKLIDFLATTLFKVIVMHEIYGTTHMMTFLDTRLMNFQLRETSTGFSLPTWDEYMSSVFVGIATSRAAFPKLATTPVGHVFDDLPEPLRSTTKSAWDEMLRGLGAVSDGAALLTQQGLAPVLLEDLELGTMY